MVLTMLNAVHSLMGLMRRAQSQRAQTLVEYSLILGLIAVAAIAGMTAFQLSMTNLYDKVKQVSDAMIAAVT